AETWWQRYGVNFGKKITLRGGAVLGANAAIIFLDLFKMYKDSNLARYTYAPYVLDDFKGAFTLHVVDPGLFSSNKYYKRYTTGDLKGQDVEIDKDEFKFWKKEAEALWGTT